MYARRLGALLLVVAGLGAFAERAEAQSSATRAIVLRFDGGARGRAAREAALAELSSHVELVTEDQAIATAESMGVDVSSPGGMAEVVRELGVTLVVTGTVTGRRRNATTTIVVVDPDGEELARQDAPEPRGAESLAEIGQAAVAAVDAANAELEARRQAAEAAAAPAPVQQIVYDDEGDDEEEEERAPRTGWRQPAAMLLAGLRVRSVGTYVDEQTTNTQHFFEADLYPEIEIVTWFRPLTDENDELLRGLLFGLRGAFSVGLSYIAQPSGVEGAMTSFRFRADVGYGYTIEDVFELSGMIGFGIDGVELEMAGAFPSTLFSYLRPGVMGRVALYEQLFVLDLGIGGRIGVDGGALPAAFGPGMFFGGVDLQLGLSGIVEPGFTWAARFGYVFHALSFDGGGGPSGVGSGGLDETLEIRLLVGWAF